MTDKSGPTLSPALQVLLALILPISGAVLVTLFSGSGTGDSAAATRLAVLQFTSLGVISLLLGYFWYGLNGLGLRMRRPLFASIGFAVVGWVIYLVVRLATVEPGAGADDAGGVPFLFLLLFEAFCSQIWTYGLFFKAVAGWRGPLTAAVSSGILFGALALLLFQEAFAITASSVLFFAVWGILYGIIRLRTGSLLGTALIQALQSWTAWQLFKVGQPDLVQLRNMYLITSLLYAILIWRLWPKNEADYRV